MPAPCLSAATCDGLGPREHHAQTSHDRPNLPSSTVESLSLMSLFIVVALRSAWLVCCCPYLVVVVLDDHLREQRDGLGPSDHHAKTSSERPNQPSATAESPSLMSFLIVVALRSAWLVRRRLYLGAKHEQLLAKERRSREEGRGTMIWSGQNHWTAAIPTPEWWG